MVTKGASPGEQAKRTRGERTRAALVKAAAERFRRLGFQRATTVEIARDAGVVEGTLFLHFGSKTGLLAGVMQAYYDELVEDLAEHASQGGTPEGRLRSLVGFWLRRVRGDWSLMRVFGQYGRFSDDPEMVARFTAMNRRVTRFFGGLFEDLKAAGVIRPEFPSYVLRDALFGAAEHLLIGMENTGRDRDLGQAADHLCDLLLGLSAPSTTVGPDLVSLDAKVDRLLVAMGKLDGGSENGP